MKYGLIWLPISYIIGYIIGGHCNLDRWIFAMVFALLIDKCIFYGILLDKVRFYKEVK